MSSARFIQPDGTEQTIDIPDGWSLMEGARKESIPGIVAECGGGAVCSTCHVIVTPEWFEIVGAPSATEEFLLDMAPEREPTSRLSCQIIMSGSLDGLTVKVPTTQSS